MILMSIIIVLVLIFIIAIIAMILKRRADIKASLETKNASARTKRRRLILKKKNKTNDDYEALGEKEEDIKEADELGENIVDANDKSGSGSDKDPKKEKEDGALKDMLKQVLKEEAIAFTIETSMTAAEKALKKMRSASSMKDLLDESNMKMKQSLKELNSIDFSKLPDGPDKKKLMAIVEESKKLTAEVLENSTYDKLLGTSDLTPNEVPTVDDASKLSRKADAASGAAKGSGVIDPVSGNRASMKLDALSNDLRKQLDQLDKMGPYLKKNGIKFDTFTRNNALMFVDNAKDGVKHFTDTKFLQHTRRLKQIMSDSVAKAGGKAGREAMQKANKAFNSRLTKGTQFINDCMNSSLGKGLKAAKAGADAGSAAAKNASRTATKKVGKEVLSEAGGMGIGLVVAMGVEIFSQLIESGSIDGEALAQVLKEEMIGLAIEVGILAVATGAVVAATGATAAAAFATTAGPVGAVLAVASVTGALLDASPAGKKFATVMLSKDLHAMKQNYDDTYYKYYLINKSGFERKTIKNWAGGKDIVMEGNFLDLDEYGKMTDTAVVEFAGYQAEFFEMNNLIHGPDTMDVLNDVYSDLLQSQVMKERREKVNTFLMNTILFQNERKRSPTLMRNYMKNKIEIEKAELNTLRAKARAMAAGGYNSSTRLLLTLTLKRLGFSDKKILRLTHPDY